MLLLLTLARAQEAPPEGEAEPLLVERAAVQPMATAELVPPDEPPATRCAVRVFVDETGAPYDVRPVDCADEAVFGWTRESLMKSRFHPYERDGVATRVQFDWVTGPPPPQEPEKKKKKKKAKKEKKKKT